MKLFFRIFYSFRKLAFWEDMVSIYFVVEFKIFLHIVFAHFFFEVYSLGVSSFLSLL